MGKITGNVLVHKPDGSRGLVTAKAYIAMLEDRVIAAEATRVCRVCFTLIEGHDPDGQGIDWYSHVIHPDDGHDADPLNPLDVPAVRAAADAVLDPRTGRPPLSPAARALADKLLDSLDPALNPTTPKEGTS